MVKNIKSSRKKVAANMPRRKTKRVSTVTRGGLDGPAQAYARLIADPCNAPLTTTIWPGSTGSFVSRFESDFIVFDGVAQTAGMLYFVPGMNEVYTPSLLLTNDTTASTMTNASTLPPGVTFLQASAGTFRCVAACMQVSFPGTELNRSGIVSLGVMQAGGALRNLATIAGGQNVNTTASAVRQLCQHTERTPQNMAEIIWQPGGGDQLPTQLGIATNTTSYVTEASDKNAIVMSVAGIPPVTGVRIRLVSVIEWTPRTAQGFVSSIDPPKSVNSLNDILRALPASRGSNWFINAWAKAQPYMKAAGSVISYGLKTLGPALAVM